MIKMLCFLVLLPIGCLAQVSISGTILNQADAKPVANASVFLSNATIGTKTAVDGTFSLHNLQPGKYELVVSIVGFENYSQNLTVEHVNVQLANILLSPKTIALKEVSVQYHKDPDREKYLGWFTDEFLGTSERAKDCKILNPEVLDLSYDNVKHKLTASSGGYLIIENDALGYKLKYLVTDFSLENQEETDEKIFYKGPVQFEELPGTPSQKELWFKNRQELYENSPMHFLRSSLNNTITEEGFRVQKEVNVNNPSRPSDSLISAKISFFIKSQQPFAHDSLVVWTRLSKLPKTVSKTITLNPEDFIKITDQAKMFALANGGGKMYVAYSKAHHFYGKNSQEYVSDAKNDETTLILFNAPAAFFYGNGAIINPYSVTYYGVWARNRIAELLPIDYSPVQIVEVENMLADNLTAKLDTFITTHPAEKAYLQFDKPFYAAGDTIYFKAYVATADKHRLSDLSGILHVDLIMPNNKVQQSIKLHLDSGITWGDFALPDSLPKGNYEIRAYTSLMRTDGALIPFNKVIPVSSLQSRGNLKAIIKNPRQALNSKPDIQFFPEGGNLAVGIQSKVAFKAIGSNGFGVSVKGIIVDNSGKEVITFNSVHLGMGCFFLMPEPGKTYTAKITYPNGGVGTVNLPVPENSITLAADDSDNTKVTVNLEASREYFKHNKDKDYILVVFSGGIAAALNCKLSQPAMKLGIEKSNLHTGVATITLFSSGNEPICERLVFINNHDQLALRINSNKNNFAKREKVRIDLNIKDVKGLPVEGHFSAAVINESLIPESKGNFENILSYFLLTSDLKGLVEEPGYYFADTGAVTKENLDILMLTQGYRRFEWKKIFNHANDEIMASKPEQALEISGMVKSMWGKPIANGNVTLFSPAGGMLSKPTDEKGIFHFSNLLFTDTASFILSAVNASGKNSTKLTLFPSVVEPVIPSRPVDDGQTLPDTATTKYLTNFRNGVNEQFQYGNNKSILLKEVQIREKKKDDQYRTQSLAGAGNADQVLHSKDLLGGQLSTSLYLLRGVTVLNKGSAATPFLTLGMHQPMLVIIDGTELVATPNNPINVNLVNATDVETIEVLSSAKASMYGMSGAGGVLIITTKQGGSEVFKGEPVGVLPVKIAGFYKARTFYSPKYDVGDLPVGQRDFRSTIYWQPELVTDKNGNASITYFNADGTGTYKVILEGVDDNGNLGRQEFEYKVE